MTEGSIFSPNTSLAGRLTSGAGMLGVVLLGGIVLVLSTIYTSQIITILDDELDRAMIGLQGAVNADPIGGITLNPDRLPSDPDFQRPLSGRYWIIFRANTAQTYQRVEASNSVWDDDIVIPPQTYRDILDNPGQAVRFDGTGPEFAEGSSNYEPLRLLGVSMILPQLEDPVILLVGFNREKTDSGSLRFTLILAGTMALLGVGFLIAISFGIRSALRPLRRIEADIADVREGRRTLMETDYPAEVLPLNLELNKLLEHNRGVVERAQTHVGNLAHALKTPLAVLMNEARGDAPLDDVVRRQAGTMHDSVQHYLKRARAAARAEVMGARSEVLPVLDDLGRLLNKLFADQGVIVKVDCPTGLYARADKQELEEMVGNLMENACKWSGGEVTVLAQGEAESVVIHIDDNGDGLLPAERSAALQRGVRLDEKAPGTGLGLSIVTELAEMHGGALVLEDAPVLGGLRASLRLPLA